MPRQEACCRRAFTRRPATSLGTIPHPSTAGKGQRWRFGYGRAPPLTSRGGRRQACPCRCDLASIHRARYAGGGPGSGGEKGSGAVKVRCACSSRRILFVKEAKRRKRKLLVGCEAERGQRGLRPQRPASSLVNNNIPVMWRQYSQPASQPVNSSSAVVTTECALAWRMARAVQCTHHALLLCCLHERGRVPCAGGTCVPRVVADNPSKAGPEGSAPLPALGPRRCARAKPASQAFKLFKCV